MLKKSIIILLVLLAIGCGGKKEKDNQVENTVLEQEIESIEAVTEELKNTEESIEASIKKLDAMLNEIED